MEKRELQKLAQKIQLEIKESEINTYLKEFKKLEKLLISFKKAKINPQIKPMVKINIGYLTLLEVKKLEKAFSESLISKKNLKDSSLIITKENLISFRKIN